MVIAGLYISLLLCLSINLFIFIYHWIFEFYFIFLFIYPLFISIFTLLYSSLLSLFIVDIKSIIAYSTIGQIAYILLSLYISSSISLSHIFIHSFYKCLLFLLSAEIIHIIQSNWQFIYNFYINNSLIRSYYILSGIALIFASTKEGILHHIIITSIYFFVVLFISSILALLYILFLLLFLLFYNSRILLSLSIFAFFSLSLIISIADKSFHYYISIIDYPHSFPLYISAILSSVIIILLLLLFTLSNVIFFIFYLSQLIIFFSFPFSFWSPNFFIISYISSTNFYRFPIYIFDLFGRFRAINITFFRSEFLLILLLSLFLILLAKTY